MPRTSSVDLDREEAGTKPRNGCMPASLIAVLSLMLVGAAIFSASMVERTILTPYESCIYPNVYVMGENLGGFTTEEAKQHLGEIFAHWDAGDLVLSDGEHTWRTPWSEAGMQLDAEATARRAFAAGRDQGWRAFISLWFGEHRWSPRLDVSPVFSIDAEATRHALERMAHELHKAPTDAALRLDGDQVIATPSQPGRALDIDATTEKIVNTITHLGPDYPFAPTYRTVEPSVVDVSAARAEAEAMLDREIHVTARGKHEGETFAWGWTLGRETIADWLSVEKTDVSPHFAVQVDRNVVDATVAGLATEPEADDWGFPDEEATARILEVFEAGGGAVAVELTPPPRIYVVQSGDRLTTVAVKFGMPPGLIAEVNQDVNLNQLYVGQELTIPPQDVLTPYEPVPSKKIVISIDEQRLRAYENDQLLYDWLCSTGKEDSPTYRGHFQVLSKEEMAYASQWDLQMPHFIGVYRAGGDTYNGIHALPILANGQRLWAGHLGSRASFGCIILGIQEAETLFNWAELGVSVIIE